MRFRGFTLLDISASIVVIGLVGAASTSTMQKTIKDTQVVSEANRFFEDVVRVRNEVMVGNPTNQQLLIEHSVMPAFFKRNLLRSCNEWIDYAPAYASHAINQLVVNNDYSKLLITWPNDGNHHLGICMDSTGRAQACNLVTGDCVPKTVDTVVAVRKRSNGSLIGNLIIRPDGTMFATWAETDNKQTSVASGMTNVMVRTDPVIMITSYNSNMQVLVDQSRARAASPLP